MPAPLKSLKLGLRRRCNLADNRLLKFSLEMDMSSGVNIQKRHLFGWEVGKREREERDSKITGDVLGKHPACPARPIRDKSHCIHPGRTHKEEERRQRALDRR